MKLTLDTEYYLLHKEKYKHDPVLAQNMIYEFSAFADDLQEVGDRFNTELAWINTDWKSKIPFGKGDSTNSLAFLLSATSKYKVFACCRHSLVKAWSKAKVKLSDNKGNNMEIIRIFDQLPDYNIDLGFIVTENKNPKGYHALALSDTSPLEYANLLGLYKNKIDITYRGRKYGNNYSLCIGEALSIKDLDKIHQGILSVIDQDKHGIMIGQTVGPGNSGSPVLTEQGLKGMLCKGRDEYTHYNNYRGAIGVYLRMGTILNYYKRFVHPIVMGM